MYVNAVVNAGPREDSTRIGAGGIVRRQAVDVAPFRRVNQAIYQIGIGVSRLLIHLQQLAWAYPLTSARCVVHYSPSAGP